jgi:hypothetical protein
MEKESLIVYNRVVLDKKEGPPPYSFVKGLHKKKKKKKKRNRQKSSEITNSCQKRLKQALMACLSDFF